jgi:peptide/nickel transport system ATP-binding protein
MYLGQMVEKAPAEELFAETRHPYTKALLSAIPIPDVHVRNRRILLEGEITSPINPKDGCRFAARCPYASEECNEQQSLVECSPGHFVQCCKYNKLENGGTK